MSFKWTWLAVALAVIFAMALGGFAVWFLARSLERLLASRGRGKRSLDPETVGDSSEPALPRQGNPSRVRFLQDPLNLDYGPKARVHPYVKEMQENPNIWYQPDLYRLPSPAPSSPRSADIGTTIGYPLPQQPKRVERPRPSSYCSSSDYPRSWVTVAHDSSGSPLTLDATTPHVSLRINADRSSRWAAETTSDIISRRGSWPSQSSLLRVHTIRSRNSSPDEAKTSVRRPLFGHLQNDPCTASSVLDSDSVDSPSLDSWTDEHRPMTGSESNFKNHAIRRYHANPGPRAPLPCNLYSGQELTASSMQLMRSHVRPRPAKVLDVSSLKRR